VSLTDPEGVGFHGGVLGGMCRSVDRRGVAKCRKGHQRNLLGQACHLRLRVLGQKGRTPEIHSLGLLRTHLFTLLENLSPAVLDSAAFVVLLSGRYVFRPVRINLAPPLLHRQASRLFCCLLGGLQFDSIVVVAINVMIGCLGGTMGCVRCSLSCLVLLGVWG
jgi:hypothetical protein